AALQERKHACAFHLRGTCAPRRARAYVCGSFDKMRPVVFFRDSGLDRGRAGLISSVSVSGRGERSADSFQLLFELISGEAQVLVAWRR
ncbi:hypothetical protein AMJ85_11650, partial [candidate division BRC1 bacterium SM23_51]